MKTTITILSLLVLNFSFAQLQTSNLPTIEDITSGVNNVLLGEGVAVSNITYSGSFDQIASFNQGYGFGMTSGIALSSGIATDIFLGNSNVQPQAGTVNFDMDLQAVASSVPALIGQDFTTGNTFDVSSLEFDFVPLGDNISFNFIFGSEEYPEWVNSPFNDVFAFFISGPGISGTLNSSGESVVNIAIVPNSDPQLPITVSTVNQNLNSEYYIPNYNSNNLDVDGYTTPIQAGLTGLQAGETYHIRLAIADCMDGVYNSYILLESGTFNSSVPAMGYENADFSGDGIIDINDLIILMSDFGCINSCSADATGDGLVTVADIQFFISAFGIIVN